MEATEALAGLGVAADTLSAEEKAFLDAQGYLPLYDVMTAAQAQQMADCLEEVAAAEGARAGQELLDSPMIKHPKEAGVHRMSDLVNKDPVFTICFTHPRVLAAIRHVIGPELKLSSLNSRIALPGEGLQKLHADYPEAVAPGDYRVCNSIWLLDDFTEENGATRFVPGTRRARSQSSVVKARDGPDVAGRA